MLPVTPKNGPRSSKSVLILEDDPQWQTVVRQMVKSVDGTAKVQCVPSMAGALSLMDQGETFDLIVADQTVEGESTGLDLYNHLRRENSESSFVMLSGLAAVDFAELVETKAGSHSPLFISKLDGFEMITGALRVELNGLSIAPAAAVTPAAINAPVSRAQAETYLMAVMIALMILFVATRQSSPSSFVEVGSTLSAPTLKNRILKGETATARTIVHAVNH